MREIKPGNTPCYCINFRRAANTLTKFYDKVLAPINLTASQFSLLNDIKTLKSCNKSELAQYARLDRTTIIRNLNVLREKGLIEDVKDNGYRNILVQLTETGESALMDGNTRWKQAQNQIKSTIGLECIPVLKQILANIESLNDHEN